MRPFSMEIENALIIKIDLSKSDTAYTVRAVDAFTLGLPLNVAIISNFAICSWFLLSSNPL